MGYIHELRQYVGNKSLIMVGTTVLIINQQDKLLLIKRSDNGYWGVPGGAMELGESIEDTARRETKEETELEIGEMFLFGVFSGPELFYEYPNGAQVYNVSVVYVARDVRGEVKTGKDEHVEFGFFGIRELPTRVSPPVRPILKSFARAWSEGKDVDAEHAFSRQTSRIR